MKTKNTIIIYLLLSFNLFAQPNKNTKTDTLTITAEDSTKVKELANLTKLETSIIGISYSLNKFQDYHSEVKDSIKDIKYSLINMNDTLTEIQKLMVKVSSEIAEKKKKKNRLSPFQFSMGFNFDFLDGIVAQDLYADINVNFPFIFRNITSKKTCESSKAINSNSGCQEIEINSLSELVSFEFGVYQMRTASYLDSINSEYRTIYSTNENSIHKLKFVTGNAIETRLVKRKNLGIFIQPKINIKYCPSANSEFFTSLSLLGHFEWIRSEIKVNDNRSYINIDTTDSAPLDWSRPYETMNGLPKTIKNNNTHIENNSIIGLGLDLLIVKPSGSIHFKPILGMNWLKTLGNTEKGRSVTKYPELLSYIIQAEISEHKLLGLKLGVEVRGFYKVKGHYPLEMRIPSYTVYLSKQFDLEQIATLFNAK